MVTKHKKVLGIFGGVLLFLAVFNFSGSHVSAATVSVSNDCTINEAITALNGAADGSGCTSTGDAYGTNDTLSIPEGTWTAPGDLLGISVDVLVKGAGKTQSIVDMDDNQGFTDLVSPVMTGTIIFEDLRITNANTYAIFLQELTEVSLTNVVVDNSDKGVNISKVTNVNVRDSEFKDNEYNHPSDDIQCGLFVAVAGADEADAPTILVERTKVTDNTCSGDNNSSNSAGLIIGVDDRLVGNESEKVSRHSVTLRSTVIMRNKGSISAGLYIINGEGPTASVKVDLLVDATTIAENEAEDDEALVVSEGQAHSPVFSGIYVSVNLNDQNNLTNTTVAGNRVTLLATDNRNATSGFWGVLPLVSANLKLVNTTVVDNNVSQPDRTIALSAFIVLKVDIDVSNFPTIIVNDVQVGSSSLNGLIAHNFTNSSAANCSQSLDLPALVSGATGTINPTPDNLGFNMSDDNTCGGYRVEANLWDTIEHQVADNGGPVPTIKLLPGSPAINGGGAVQGISTDARGVARTGYISVGAYQGELLAATTTNSNGGNLANTGALTISAIVLGAIILIDLLIIYRDYLRHKKPLKAVDPDVNYSFMHHVRVVTIPLFKYRVSIKVTRKSSLDANRNNPDGLRKF